jgi:hypothetical protein
MVDGGAPSTSQVRAIKASVLDKMLDRWHANVSTKPELNIEYVTALRRLQCFCGSGSLPNWSLCAGSGVTTHFHRALVRSYKRHFDIDIGIPTVLYCENKPSKQAHLIKEFAPAMLVSNLSELDADAAINQVATSAAPQLLPHSFSLDGGIPCTSRTPLSSRSKANVNCVQESKAATGMGCAQIGRAITCHQPYKVSLECVVQLDAKAGGSEISDSEFIERDILRKKGYWTHSQQLNAPDFGAPYPRLRRYWGGLLGLQAVGNDTITSFFNRVLTAFKVELGFLTMHDFLTIDDAQREREARAIGIPMHCDFDKRVSKRNVGDPGWKSEHKELYTQIGVVWPLNDVQTPSSIDDSGMLPQQYELVVFVDIVFPPTATATAEEIHLEFLDANPTLVRTLPNNIDMATVMDSPDLRRQMSPWKKTPPTLVGSVKVAVRVVQGSTSTIRILEGFEYMRMIGWDDACWAGELSANDRPSMSTAEEVELLANLAGNAYTAFHYMPWNMALLATFGKYHLNGIDDAADEDVEDDDGNDGGSDDASVSS